MDLCRFEFTADNISLLTSAILLDTALLCILLTSAICPSLFHRTLQGQGSSSGVTRTCRVLRIDKVSDSSVRISEITLANEIKDYYFLKLSTGPHMIIPKIVPSLNKEVNAMIKNYNIQHTVQLDWKWR